MIEQAENMLEVKQFYSVGIMSYCDGNVTGAHNTEFITTFCSKPKSDFWFNPAEVFNIKNITGASDNHLEKMLPNDIQKYVNAYRTASRYIFIAFCIAFGATILELLFGISAGFSRWGSCITSILDIVCLPPPIITFAKQY